MASQYRFFKIVLVGLMIVTASTVVGLKLFTAAVDQRIEESKEQYGRVVPIVEDIKTLRAQMGNLAHLPVEEAVWNIIDDLLIEKNLTSFRSTSMDDEEEGIQVTFDGLSLSKLTDFMQALRERAALQTPKCTLTRNPDDPRLADVHFVLAR